MYFPRLAAADGRLCRIALELTRVRRPRSERADGQDREWLWETVQRECRRLDAFPPAALSVKRPFLFTR